MPCREMVMPLAFCASQRLDLPVNRQTERLPDYLQLGTQINLKSGNIQI